MIDATRNVAIWSWNAKGEAFGNDTPNQDPDQDGTAFVFDLRFPGQRYDAATGLNYNYFRDYDAGSGRYVQSDPIGLSGGIGTFLYVDNSPSASLDPFGLSKGEKRNLSVGSLNKKSSAKEVEAALKDAKKNGASKSHINNLRGLLKVIKRGGTMAEGALPLWLLENLWKEQCEAGDYNACSFYCQFNECTIEQPPVATIQNIRMPFMSNSPMGPDQNEQEGICE